MRSSMSLIHARPAFGVFHRFRARQYPSLSSFASGNASANSFGIRVWYCFATHLLVDARIGRRQPVEVRGEVLGPHANQAAHADGDELARVDQAARGPHADRQLLGDHLEREQLHGWASSPSNRRPCATVTRARCRRLATASDVQLLGARKHAAQQYFLRPFRALAWSGVGARHTAQARGGAVGLRQRLEQYFRQCLDFAYSAVAPPHERQVTPLLRAASHTAESRHTMGTSRR